MQGKNNIRNQKEPFCLALPALPYQVNTSSASSSVSPVSPSLEPYFSAIAVVPGVLQSKHPYKLNDGQTVYVLAEFVNRSVRLLKAKWANNKLITCRPWTFVWLVDLILQTMSAMQQQEQPTTQLYTVMVFPIGWLIPNSHGHDSGDSDGVGLEGSCVSKSGSLPYLTITNWEEDPQPLYCIVVHSLVSFLFLQWFNLSMCLFICLFIIYFEVWVDVEVKACFRVQRVAWNQRLKWGYLITFPTFNKFVNDPFQ